MPRPDMGCGAIGWMDGSLVLRPADNIRALISFAMEKVESYKYYTKLI
jgi:hypothetical protein